MSSFLFFYGILALPFELRKFHFLKFHFVEYSNGNRQFFHYNSPKGSCFVLYKIYEAFNISMIIDRKGFLI
jgi:hypothetical protein